MTGNLLTDKPYKQAKGAKPFGYLTCQLWDSEQYVHARAFLPDTIQGRYKADVGWCWLCCPPEKYGGPARLFIGYRTSTKEMLKSGLRRCGTVWGYVCNGRGHEAKNGRYGP